MGKHEDEEADGLFLSQVPEKLVVEDSEESC